MQTLIIDSQAKLQELKFDDVRHYIAVDTEFRKFGGKTHEFCLSLIQFCYYDSQSNKIIVIVDYHSIKGEIFSKYDCNVDACDGSSQAIENNNGLDIALSPLIGKISNETDKMHTIYYHHAPNKYDDSPYAKLYNSFAEIRALFINSSVLKVFHSCYQDIEFLFCSLHVLPFPIFDTQIGDLFLGSKNSLSYEKIVEKYLKLKIQKDLDYKKWLQRPLPNEYIRYAINDVSLLCDLYRPLRRILIREGKFEWALEESESIAHKCVESHDIYMHFRNEYDQGNKQAFVGHSEIDGVANEDISNDVKNDISDDKKIVNEDAVNEDRSNDADMCNDIYNNNDDLKSDVIKPKTSGHTSSHSIILYLILLWRQFMAQYLHISQESVISRIDVNNLSKELLFYSANIECKITIHELKDDIGRISKKYFTHHFVAKSIRDHFTSFFFRLISIIPDIGPPHHAIINLSNQQILSNQQQINIIRTNSQLLLEKSDIYHQNNREESKKDNEISRYVVDLALRIIASKNNISPSILYNKLDVLQIISTSKKGAANQSRLAHGWRNKMCGEIISSILNGKAAVSIHDVINI